MKPDQADVCHFWFRHLFSLKLDFWAVKNYKFYTKKFQSIKSGLVQVIEQKVKKYTFVNDTIFGVGEISRTHLFNRMQCQRHRPCSEFLRLSHRLSLGTCRSSVSTHFWGFEPRSFTIFVATRIASGIVFGQASANSTLNLPKNTSILPRWPP